MIGTTYYTGFLDPVDDLTQFPYSTTSVAKMLTNRRVNGNIKLRRFLTEMGVIERGIPAQRYLKAGYFTVVYKPRYKTYDPVIKVSKAGVDFIQDLVRTNLMEDENKERYLKTLKYRI